jgi:hypothetical protein
LKKRSTISITGRIASISYVEVAKDVAEKALKAKTISHLGSELLLWKTEIGLHFDCRTRPVRWEDGQVDGLPWEGAAWPRLIRRDDLKLVVDGEIVRHRRLEYLSPEAQKVVVGDSDSTFLIKEETSVGAFAEKIIDGGFDSSKLTLDWVLLSLGTSSKFAVLRAAYGGEKFEMHPKDLSAASPRLFLPNGMMMLT